MSNTTIALFLITFLATGCSKRESTQPENGNPKQKTVELDACRNYPKKEDIARLTLAADAGDKKSRDLLINYYKLKFLTKRDIEEGLRLAEDKIKNTDQNTDEYYKAKEERDYFIRVLKDKNKGLYPEENTINNRFSEKDLFEIK